MSNRRHAAACLESLRAGSEILGLAGAVGFSLPALFPSPVKGRGKRGGALGRQLAVSGMR